MSKRNILLDSLQLLLSENELQAILKKYNYCDSDRKLTVNEFLKFSITTAAEQWESYRDGEDRLRAQSDIVHVDHSTLAKKQKDFLLLFLKRSFTD